MVTTEKADPRFLYKQSYREAKEEERRQQLELIKLLQSNFARDVFLVNF